ncbi:MULTISPECIES: ABC transporter permease [Sphingobacterium]|uniref:ABC transporter permease n=1 Tax=Sphingobacterium populi TaxID=1812824 RepID=A0ABW5UER9_9SPHI|nr:ABC transporter permease [Sphingobacterium sp. CFCC 11742]
MTKNDIKTTFRYLWRNRLFTALNIVGLSIGISACWLVFSMVHYEFSFDKKIPDLENIYQIVTEIQYEEEHHHSAGVNLGLALLMEEQALDDALVVPVYKQYFERFIAPQKKESEKQVVLEDQENVISTHTSYFELLPYEWIAGNAKTAFNHPKNIVLIESKAKTLFPKDDISSILGRVVLADTTQFVVSGIVKDLSFPSSFQAQIFLPVQDSEWKPEWNSRNSAHLLYVKTANKASLQHLLRAGQKRYQEIAGEANAKHGYTSNFVSMPLAEKHFNTDYDIDGLVANKKVIYGLIAIGAFLLILACINYVNLSTAQVPQRAKEIGIRKTLGARPLSLTFDFLLETFCICLLSLLLSWPIVSLFRNLYPEFLPAGMDSYSNTWIIAAFLLVLTVIITVLAGLYPSYLINQLRVIETLKGKLETRIQGTKLTLRKGLIVFQFIIAQFFIVGALIMAYQLNFTLTKDLGFSHDAVVTVRMPFKSYHNADVAPALYKQALEKHPEIAKIARGHEPQNQNHWGNTYSFAADTGRVRFNTPLKYIDEDFIDLYEIELLAGRNLKQTDTIYDVLINESGLNALGLRSPNEAIGKQLLQGEHKALPIVGVFKNFHQKSLRTQIEPLILVSSNNSNQLQTFHIKLPTDSKLWPKAFAIMEREWKALYPDAPFGYQFADEKIKNLYEKEHRTAKLIDLATAVTIFISCLGLFGLATLTAVQRTKEIGIRKVLGASVASILGLLSKDFVKIILIAILIASPVAWWAMNKWLEDFAYRIEIQWWMFAIAGLAALIIALLTVSGQTLKAALTNPVKSLRDE